MYIQIFYWFDVGRNSLCVAICMVICKWIENIFDVTVRHIYNTHTDTVKRSRRDAASFWDWPEWYKYDIEHCFQLTIEVNIKFQVHFVFILNSQSIEKSTETNSRLCERKRYRCLWRQLSALNRCRTPSTNQMAVHFQCMKHKHRTIALIRPRYHQTVPGRVIKLENYAKYSVWKLKIISSIENI